jgi:photosystem II cytochrome c550
MYTIQEIISIYKNLLRSLFIIIKPEFPMRNMLKRLLLLVIATLMFAFQSVTFPAQAVELDAAIRTVVLNPEGETVTMSMKQVVTGRRLFSDTCAQCHAGGVTKTDFNVGLSPRDLSGATPARNNVNALVDYLKHPTTYDGETSISELHPATESADIFTEMKNLSDADLTAIAGHILMQPKIMGEQWGGGKTVR